MAKRKVGTEKWGSRTVAMINLTMLVGFCQLGTNLNMSGKQES